MKNSKKLKSEQQVTYSKVICTTCVKDEAENIERFLNAASEWADQIIVVNHASSDDTKEIALRNPKVKVIDYMNQSFDEAARRQIQFDEVRKIPGKKIVFNLDADEFLYGFRDNPDWNDMLLSDSCQSYSFKWPNLLPDLKTFFRPPEGIITAAFNDNGEVYNQELKIHVERVPKTEKIKNISTISILHAQYLNWEAMCAKQKYYQVYEALNSPEKNPIGIYRQYSHMYRNSKKYRDKLPDLVIEHIHNNKIDEMRHNNNEIQKWNTRLEILVEKGDQSKLKYIDLKGNKNLILRYLRATKNLQMTITTRIVDKILKVLINV